MNRHAYLIIIHNNFYNFEKLLQLLDDERNDIYVHVNKKVKNFDFDKYAKIIKKSKILFSKKRFPIFWGSPLLLKTEMHLLKQAYNSGKYSYFHLLSGSDLPIKSKDYIYDYFEKYKREFVSFSDNWDEKLLKYYYVFDGFLHTEHNKYISFLFRNIESIILSIQKKIGVDRLKRFEVISKGSNWFSITPQFAKICIEEYEKKYRELFRFTILPEENFVQMMALLNKHTISISKEGNMRYVKWMGMDSPAVLEMSDWKDLKNSECLFARKFDADKDIDIINKIFSMYNTV